MYQPNTIALLVRDDRHPAYPFTRIISPEHVDVWEIRERDSPFERTQMEMTVKVDLDRVDPAERAEVMAVLDMQSMFRLCPVTVHVLFPADQAELPAYVTRGSRRVVPARPIPLWTMGDDLPSYRFQHGPQQTLEIELVSYTGLRPAVPEMLIAPPLGVWHSITQAEQERRAVETAAALAGLYKPWET
jgi:hypothetical protein